MKLSNFSVDRPVAVLMAVLAVVMIGFVSLSGLYLDLMPEMELPVAIVVTDYTGSAPQEVENLISRPLEEVLGTVGNVKEISSMSSLGSSIVIAQFEMGTDMEFAALEMREKVDLVRGFLPDDAGDPMVLKMDVNLMPVLVLGVSGDRTAEELKTVVEDVIKPRLERLDGVASVGVAGGLVREIQVIVESEKLAAHGLTITDIVQALQMENINLSAGKATKGHQEMAFRVIGEYGAVEQIAKTALQTPSGAQLHLGDVARVEDGFKDSSGFSRIGERDGISLSIQKQSGANTVSVVRNTRNALEKVKSQLPEDIALFTVLDQAEYIEFSISHVTSNLLLGGFLAVLVLFVFLRSLRSTLIIALAMPISVVTTFTLIYFGGLNLNMMTLGGLALGIGMMVDSSIVVLENIFRLREQGLGLMEAAKSGTAEVANAITASIFTTIAVFFPIVYVKGIVSEVFSALALTVSFSLLSSLLVALTLVPMLSSRLLRVDLKPGGEGAAFDQGGARPGSHPGSASDPDPDSDPGSGSDAGRRSPGGLVQRLMEVTGGWFEKLYDLYRSALVWCLSRRALTVIIVVALLLGSLALVPAIGAEFLPAMDQGMITVEIELPHGSRLEETDRVVTAVEQAFSRYEDDIELIFSSIGSDGGEAGGIMGSMGGGGSNQGGIYVSLLPLQERKRSTQEVVEGVRQQVSAIPGAEISVLASDMGFNIQMFSTPVEVSLSGEDLDLLEMLSAEIADLVRSIPGTREVTTSLEEGQTEIQLVVDRDKAGVYGLSTAQIASTARTAVEGQVATRYRTGSEEIDVRVRLSEGGSTDLAEIENMQVASPLGLLVPLGEVAEILEVQTPSTIMRNDQARVVSITAQLEGRALADVMQEVQQTVSENIALPTGYLVEYGGQFELMDEAFGDLFLALLMAIVLVYMVLAAQFESLLYPFVIMFSLPVTVIGVIVALAVTGNTLNIVSFIGIIMLAGIVVNNAIVLVDYINQLRRRGLERDEAVLTAGPIRLRPVLMTSLTTILAMLPLAFGGGEGAELQASMATAVIGGLTTSTFLTLFLVPVVYSLFDDLSGFWQRRRRSSKAVQTTTLNGSGPGSSG
ncbi:MAG: efflux RND transporter permease subunit [Firmicutes bacterium]|nr:efflux RND transporter permease subunit [Bacillota bacterium]